MSFHEPPSTVLYPDIHEHARLARTFALVLYYGGTEPGYNGHILVSVDLNVAMFKRY